MKYIQINGKWAVCWLKINILSARHTRTYTFYALIAPNGTSDNPSIFLVNWQIGSKHWTRIHTPKNVYRIHILCATVNTKYAYNYKERDTNNTTSKSAVAIPALFYCGNIAAWLCVFFSFPFSCITILLLPNTFMWFLSPNLHRISGFI